MIAPEQAGSLLTDVLSHVALLGVVWFFLRRLVAQLDGLSKMVSDHEKALARIDERHDIEDRAAGAVRVPDGFTLPVAARREP